MTTKPGQRGISPRLRLVARVAAINLALLIAGGLVLELTFGNWFSDGNLGPVRVPRDVTLYPDVSNLYPTDKPVIYRRDIIGLRGSYKDVSDIDILTIGGSTTDQLYLSEGSTWQDVLAEKFRSKGNDVDVVNAGVQGQSTYGHLLNFEFWFPRIKDLKARYILAYVGLNDSYIPAATWSDKIVKDSTGARMQQTIRNNSAIYDLVRTIKGMFAAREAGLIHKPLDYSNAVWTDEPMHRDQAQRYGSRVDAYEKRLRKMIQEIQDMGARPILMTQISGAVRWRDDVLYGLVDGFTDNAEFYKLNNGLDRHIALSLFNARTLSVCYEIRDALCIDLANEIRFEDADFYDYAHTTPAGARRIADYLYAKLEPYF